MQYSECYGILCVEDLLIDSSWGADFVEKRLDANTRLAWALP